MFQKYANKIIAVLELCIRLLIIIIIIKIIFLIIIIIIMKFIIIITKANLVAKRQVDLPFLSKAKLKVPARSPFWNSITSGTQTKI